MSMKEKVIYPVLVTFLTLLGTALASKITEGSVLDWMGAVVRSKPVTITEFQKVPDLGSQGKTFFCQGGGFISSCFAGLYPSGEQFCGSSITLTETGGECKVNGCGSAKGNRGEGSYWGITLGCQR